MQLKKTRKGLTLILPVILHGKRQGGRNAQIQQIRIQKRRHPNRVPFVMGCEG